MPSEPTIPPCATAVRDGVPGHPRPLYAPTTVTLSRTAALAISAPAFPARLAPGTIRQQSGHTAGTPDSAPHVRPEHPHERGPFVAVRGKADGYTDRATGTHAVRHMSVDTATQRSTARQGDTHRDTEETARIAENPQLAGRLRRWWQVMDSNHRRLSRRFYSEPTAAHRNAF